MRIAMVLAVALLGTTCLAQAEHAQAAMKHYPLNIPRQSLDTALRDLAQQTGLQIGRFSERVDGSAIVGPVQGEQTPEQALQTLLLHTGLQYKIVSDTTIAVYNPKHTSSAQFNTPPPASEAGARARESNDSKEGTQNKSFWDRFRLAQAPQGGAARSSSVEQGGTRQTPQKGPVELQEVVVTAQKREERLQDVPVPVTAISGQTLAESGEVRLQEYYSSVPGLSVSPSGGLGNPQAITIRGINSGSSNSTVGVTVDDVPFGSSYLYGANITPDFDPSDLARVEVLRGPQGTLYGASSMGGLLKFVTVDPSTAGLSGRVQADVNSVHNAAEPGYGFRGAVNIPITDDLAIRASGFTRHDAGYIDNPVQDRTGVNEEHVNGGRVSALWSPSDVFKLKLSALYQDTRGGSTSEVDLAPGLKDLQQNNAVGCCGFDKKLQAYSATMTARLGSVDLASVTGYNVTSFATSTDYSYLFGALAQAVFGTGTVRYEPAASIHKFTQEVRASVPIGEMFEWLIGGFYQHETSRFDVNIPAVSPITGAEIGNLTNIILPYDYNEKSIFTDLTIHLTRRFNIQLGGRESFLNQETGTAFEGGPLFGGNFTVPAGNTPVNVFTFQVTPQYRVSPDLMLYSRIASGYREGISNIALPDPSIPKASVPDKTVNYEIGAKGDLVANVLSFDTSLYYIDWNNIQLTVTDPRNGFVYYTNGSRAKSEGLELALEARPLGGLTIRAWYSYDEAVLTQNVPSGSTIYGTAGNRLAYSPRNSANFAASQAFSLGSETTGYVGAQLSYVGDRLGIFESTAERSDYPAYTKVDLNAGITYGDWSATLYANNVADRRGLLGGGLGTYPPYAYYLIQPRTIGLSLVRKF